MPPPDATRRIRPQTLPDPDTLGLTEPNDKGRRYRHGTLTAYQLAKCRCPHCKDAIATYRAERRAGGKDTPRRPRAAQTDTDGHINGGWFRGTIWAKALKTADIGVHVTPHGLRHAHASWLLAGGADLQMVKERLGHGSITTDGYLRALPTAQDKALSALDAIRGERTANAATTPPAVREGDAEQTVDARDAELAELRGTVAKFKEILGDVQTTA